MEIVLALFSVLVIFALGFFCLKAAMPWIKSQVERSFRDAHQEFLNLASERLSTERTQHVGDLDLRKQEVEKLVQGLEKQLQRYEQTVQALEKDRDTKYGALTQQLAQTAQETRQLKSTTDQLTTMLGNSRIRGQWGEKTAEDILKLCGLQHQIHYIKQSQTDAGKPDFTFLLPDGHHLYMDVKFPLDNFMKFMNAENDAAGYQDQFVKDVKKHIKELDRRAYAGAGKRGSPDYMIMFIPNEQVYSRVNEWVPELLDESLSKHIIVCGPWTLYAHVRLIWQAWQQYYHEQTISEITKTVNEFLRSYEIFKKRFTDLGDRLEGASKKYEEIVRTSYNKLDQKIQRIEDYRKGKGLESPLEVENTEQNDGLSGVESIEETEKVG